MTVTATPAGLPIPSRITAGSRYTYAGIIWAASSIGLTTRSTTWEKPAATPSGMPIATATAIETVMRPSVAML